MPALKRRMLATNRFQIGGVCYRFPAIASGAGFGIQLGEVAIAPATKYPVSGRELVILPLVERNKDESQNQRGIVMRVVRRHCLLLFCSVGSHIQTLLE